MNKTKKQKSLLFIVLLIIVISYILIKREKEPVQSLYHINKVPNLESVDIDGRTIKSSNFTGKKLYIQFINSFFQPDIILFKTVYEKWSSEDLYFLGIISNSNVLNHKEKSNFKRITLIEKDFDAFCRKFNVTKNNGFYFIVDEKGIIVSSGQNDLGYEKGPKIFLKKFIKGDFFSISEFIRENENINKLRWFSQASKLINDQKNKNYFLISLFTKICNSCSGGEILRALDKINKKDKNKSMYILCILNRSKFRDKDIPILKSQLKIDFPTIIADYNLNKKWDSLIKRYNEDLLTDIIFLLDESGKIIKVADRTCKCLPSFFNHVNSLIEEEEGE